VPFVFLPVGSSPLIYSLDSKFTNVMSFGESVFAGGRGLYPLKNMVLTVWASLIKKSHKRSCFIITPSGKLAIEKVPWGSDQAVPLPEGTKIEWVNPPDIAMSAPQLYNILDKEIQKSDLATIEYGMVSGTEYPSGKSIMNLQEGRDSKITPLLKTASALWTDTFEMLCEQYEQKGTKMTVKGYDSKGKLFYQEIKPTDVKKPWDIEVEFVSITPEQETANISKAQMLQSIGVSDEYIYEKAIKMSDPNKPRVQKLMQELENNNPIIKTLHQYETAKKQGMVKESQVLEKQLTLLLLQQKQQEAQLAQLPQPQGQVPQPVQEQQLQIPQQGGM